MRILVTGGCGFIGSNFIRYMLGKYKDCQIVNVDKLTYAGNIDNLKDIEIGERYRFVKADICDDLSLRASVFDIDKIDAVVNFAAETHVDRAIKDSISFVKSNILGTAILVDLVKEYNIARYIQISTDEVYGSVEKASKEGDVLNPSSPYSASKAAADLICLSHYKTYGLPMLIVRMSNNYGPWQYPEKLIPLFITNVIEGKKLPLYGDGKNERHWIYVDDACEAIDFLLGSKKEGEIYNIGGPSVINNITVADFILKEFGLGNGQIQYVKDRPGHDKKYVLDMTRLMDLGWRPKVRFQEGIKKTIKWYKENEEWWKLIKGGEKYNKFYKEQYGKNI